jgi:hypothetical protein
MNGAATVPKAAVRITSRRVRTFRFVFFMTVG